MEKLNHTAGMRDISDDESHKELHLDHSRQEASSQDMLFRLTVYCVFAFRCFSRLLALFWNSCTGFWYLWQEMSSFHLELALLNSSRPFTVLISCLEHYNNELSTRRSLCFQPFESRGSWWAKLSPA